MTDWQRNDIFALDTISLSADQSPQKKEDNNSVVDALYQNNAPGRSEFTSKIEVKSNNITVMGIGGAGMRILKKISLPKKKRIKTVAVCTDLDDLKKSKVRNKVLVGKFTSRGSGTQQDPLIGRAAVEEDYRSLEAYLNDTSLAILIAGLGGGTGSGAVPAICRLAKQKGVRTLSVVVMPFSQEGIKRHQTALLGLHRISQESNALVVISSDYLEKSNPKFNLEQCFAAADDYTANIVQRIEMISSSKEENDLNNVHLMQFLANAGSISVGFAEGERNQNIIDLLDHMCHQPLSELRFYQCRNLLLHIISGSQVDAEFKSSLIDAVSKKIKHTASITYGVRIDPQLEKRIKIMLAGTAANQVNKSSPSINTTEKKDKPQSSQASDGYQDLFDIREITLPNFDYIEETPPIQNQASGENSITFSKEIEIGLSRLRTATQNLAKQHESTEQLCTISETCSILAMSTEIILNQWATELLHAAVELTEEIISGQIAFTMEITTLFEQLPIVLEEVIVKSDAATPQALSLASSLRNCKEELQNYDMESFLLYDKEAPLLSEMDKTFFYELLDA